jgi:hypothetical protein
MTNQVKGNFKVSNLKEVEHGEYYIPIHKGVAKTGMKIPRENLKRASLIYQVGDVVRIKTKEQFARDFQIHYPSDDNKFYVQTSNTFSVSMNSYCGKAYTIVKGTFRMGYTLEGIPYYSFDSDMFATKGCFIYKEI